MFTARGISSAAGYASYLEKEAIGEWVGEAAEQLKLVGEVSPEEFNSLVRGVDPMTGERLRNVNTPDKVYVRERRDNGEQFSRVYQAREAYEMIVSATKSASVAAVFDKRILEAHDRAVQDVRMLAESACGGMVIAAYQHGYTRTLDPQLHTHLVAPNMTPKDGAWQHLNMLPLYMQHEVVTETYRERFCDELERLGYRIDYPEISGIPEEIRDQFSERTGQKIDSIETWKQEHPDCEPTNREVAVLMRKNRDPKRYPNAEQLREYQMSKLTPAEHARLEQICGQALERSEKMDIGSPRERQTQQEQPRMQAHSAVASGALEVASGILQVAKLFIPSGMPHDQHVSEGGIPHRKWTYGERMKMGMGL